MEGQSLQILIFRKRSSVQGKLCVQEKPAQPKFDMNEREGYVLPSRETRGHVSSGPQHQDRDRTWYSVPPSDK